MTRFHRLTEKLNPHALTRWLSVAAFLLPLVNCQSRDVSTYSFPSDARYRAGDDLAWSEPIYDDSDWQTIALPSPAPIPADSEPQHFWIRFRLPNLPETLSDPGIAMGKIGDADQTYFNGHLLGETGFVEGSGPSAYHRSRLYRIPKEWFTQDRDAVVAVRIKKNSILQAGIYAGPLRLGEYQAIRPVIQRDYFFVSGLGLLMGFFSFMMGLYHLYLFIRLPSKRMNLWYFFFSVASSMFILSLGWKGGEWIVSPSAVIRCHAYLGIASATLFLVFFASAVRRKMKRVEWGLGTANLLFFVGVSLTNNYQRIFQIFHFWYLVGIATIVYVGVVTLQAVRNGRHDLRALAGGTLIMLITAAADSLFGLGFWPAFQVSGIGFFALNLGIMVSLAHDFTAAYLNIEEKVATRTQELATANKQLRSLDEMKQRFFANISHDLKTPIAIAFANVEHAKRSAAVTTRHALESAENALNKLQGMVLDILDMIKAESGTLKLKWEVVSVADILKAWAAPYEPLCKKHRLTLQYAISVDRSLKVPMDVGRMERVFANLILNALKFTKDGGITVSLRSDDSRVYFEVIDTGVGVPEEERKKIFDRYYQGFNTSLRDHGGSGIGLSYVKEVVSTHNGEVWVEPAQAGSGSRFIVALPLSQDVEITGEHFVTDSDVRVSPVKGSLDVPYPHSEPVTYRPQRPSVLLVEDNPEVAQVVVNILNDTYNIYFAKDGVDALDHLSKRQIHCILSDIMMPRMDGKEFLKEVKKNERWRPIPFICLTSLSETNHMIECLNLGANNYVTKPFHQEVLLSAVATLIQNSVFREQLMAKDKMASLGLLAAGLAHEIRNPVHSATNLLEGLRKDFDRLEKIETLDAREKERTIQSLVQDAPLLSKFFRSARSSVQRIHEITEAIGSYSTGSTQLGNVDLVASVRNVLTILEGKTKENGVTVEFLEKEPIIVQAFPSLQQALMNVIDNAIDAMSSRLGKVKITITESTDEVTIEVRDDGPGIPLDQQPHLFDAFFTSKSVGTGLGLYITRAIVEYQHLGSITFHSEERRGATFQIMLKKAPDLQHRSMLDFKGFPVPV